MIDIPLSSHLLAQVERWLFILFMFLPSKKRSEMLSTFKTHLFLRFKTVFNFTKFLLCSENIGKTRRHSCCIESWSAPLIDHINCMKLKIGSFVLELERGARVLCFCSFNSSSLLEWWRKDFRWLLRSHRFLIWCSLARRKKKNAMKVSPGTLMKCMLRHKDKSSS